MKPEAKLKKMCSMPTLTQCPICNKEVLEKKYFPFCSLTCSELDMYNWFSNAYSMPAYELDDVEKDELIKFLEEESVNPKE
ncbi:DNA gyrase inhibitor YacG [Candidatus Hepatincola sp. Pdp]